ncbi:leucine-rich repeat-containing protein 24-like [Ptychodera flava]|uniref:leucine-rich repeat-containing protein 24-like n=1 Tax=Ptychodera flava TaxID=63121 RepID=UPI00396AB054
MGNRSTWHCILRISVLVFLATVTADACPTLCDCYSSVDAGNVTDCSARDLTAIPEDIPESTSFLDLSANRLVLNETSMFGGLSNLQTLNLSYNNIAEIEGAALYGLKRLAVLDLSHNGIIRLDYGDFVGLEAISEIDINNNDIVNIAANTFTAFVRLRRISLGDNALDYLDSESFSGLFTLQFLDLHGNRLQTVPGVLMDELPSLAYVDVSSNPLRCDCSLLEFRVWFSYHGQRSSAPQPRCHSPAEYANSDILAISTDDLARTCHDSTGTRMSTGGWVAVVMVAFLLGVLLTLLAIFLVRMIRERVLRNQATDTKDLTKEEQPTATS